MLKKNEINLLSKTLPFWNNLDQDEKELLISNAFIEDVDQGQLIHQGNNDCIGILVVIKGCLRTYIVSDEGKEVTLYRLNANDVCVLSAACVLDCIDFDVLVEAQTKCQIIQISPAIFLQLFSQNIHVELFSYKLATERFSDVMWAMQQILFISFDKRLAAFLLDESNRSNSLDIKMTHEQIAQNDVSNLIWQNRMNIYDELLPKEQHKSSFQFPQNLHKVRVCSLH